MDSGVKGSLGNVYGPSSFLEKQTFMAFLSWLMDQTEVGNWVLGGHFNLISNLGENKGCRRILDKYQESFYEFLTQSSLVDLEIGNGWFTWNNKREQENLVAFFLDQFLVSKNIMHSMGEIVVDVLPAAGSNHWPISLT